MSIFYCILTKSPLPGLRLELLPKPIIIPIDELNCALTMDNQKFKEKFLVDKPGIDTTMYFRCKSGISADRAVFISKDLKFKKSVNLNRILLEKFIL